MLTCSRNKRLYVLPLMVQWKPSRDRPPTKKKEEVVRVVLDDEGIFEHVRRGQLLKKGSFFLPLKKLEIDGILVEGSPSRRQTGGW